jgi:pyroglutamyl-peptidase
VTTLVTGFDPFGRMLSNPSQAAGSWLAEQRDGCVFVPVPTSYAGSITVLEESVRKHGPTAVLLLGFAASAVGLRVERYARNQTTAAAPDNDGEWQAGPIEAAGPDRIETPVDYNGLLDILDSNAIPYTTSDDAGGYVCNWLYWHTLARYPRLPILFVHLAEPGTSAAWSELRAGLLLIADSMSGSDLSTRRGAFPR